MPSIGFLIPTYNDELHLERCIQSVLPITHNIWIVDSFSTDETLTIAEQYGVKLLQRHFDYHYAQKNWALTQIGSSVDWIFHLDADEVLSDQLIYSLRFLLASIPDSTAAISFKRRIYFLGVPVTRGGIGSKNIIRCHRSLKASFLPLKMDEHLNVDGTVSYSNFFIYDINLNSIDYWFNKHIRYAKLEASQFPASRQSPRSQSSPSLLSLSLYIKRNFYSSSPLFLRSFVYFFIRYIFLFGFLDKPLAQYYHFLHALWYRLLVDFFIFTNYRKDTPV